MKEITGKQKTKSNLLPQEIKVDEIIIQILQDITNEFNKYFTSVESKLAKKFPNTEKKFPDFLTSHDEKMQFEELNFDKSEEVFQSLKQDKAVGFDDLSPNIIINGYDTILFHVFKI